MKKTLQLLMSCASLTIAAEAHEPDSQYLSELNQRLPGGDEKIVLAVMHAINNHDWTFFKFFCPDNPDVIADVQADGKVMQKDHLKLALVSGTELADYWNPTMERGASVVCVSSTDKSAAVDIHGGYFMIVIYTNADGWLKIRAVQFHDKDFTNAGILHLTQ